MIDWSRIEAIIFDNDGVIVNSEPLSCGALHQLFIQEFDIDIGNDFSTVLGTSDKYSIEYFANSHEIELKNLGKLIETKNDLYFKLAEGVLNPFPNFHELMESLVRRYDLAVASSGNHDKIKFSLEQVGASKYFPIICSATEVSKGKPAPDLFIYTAECLDVNPSKCVVVEDSLKGIQGALAAGMQTIGFSSSFSGSELNQAGATWVVEDFYEIIDELP